jgi:hypothetical protein
VLLGRLLGAAIGFRIGGLLRVLGVVGPYPTCPIVVGGAAGPMAFVARTVRQD